MTEQRRKDGEDFLKRHLHAQVGKGAKRFHTQLPIDLYHNPQMDLDPFDTRIMVEESVDISLREVDYEKLIEMLGHMSTHWSGDSYKMWSHWRDNMHFEKQLREKNPGLQKAYERYKLVLEMVRDGKEIED